MWRTATLPGTTRRSRLDTAYRAVCPTIQYPKPSELLNAPDDKVVPGCSSSAVPKAAITRTPTTRRGSQQTYHAPRANVLNGAYRLF